MDTNNLFEQIFSIPEDQWKKNMKALRQNSRDESLKEIACFFCRLNHDDIRKNNPQDDVEDINNLSKEDKDGLFVINCPYCGQYTISKELIEHIWDKPVIRLKLASIAQERKLNGKDGYTLVWNEKSNDQPEKAIYNKDSNNIFLSDYPSTDEEKINRILLNIIKICKTWPDSDLFDINPLQLGLFYLEQLNDLYNYTINDLNENLEIPTRSDIRNTVTQEIQRVIDRLIREGLIIKRKNAYGITKSAIQRINILTYYNNKIIGNFKFHGIGQGLMYTGSISSYPVNTYDTILNFPCLPTLNFIYDCGTLGDDTELQHSIDNLPSHIDFIVISHLDADHINGLVKLQNSYSSNTKIKVFLPYFDVKTYESVFKMHLIISGIKDETTINKILQIYKKSPVISNANGRQGEQIDQDYYYYLVEGDIQNPKEIPQYAKWNFYFYNRNRTRLKNFTKYVENIQKEIDEKLQTYGNIAELVNNDNEIKKKYDTYFHNRNLMSLLLLHWPANNSSTKTLLTGDVQFNTNLIARIKSVLKQPYILQVPHHGAKDSWESISKYKPYNLWKNADKLVFSVGYPFHEDDYKHPYHKHRYDHPNQICYDNMRAARYAKKNIIIVHEGDGDKIAPQSFIYQIE